MTETKLVKELKPGDYFVDDNLIEPGVLYKIVAKLHNFYFIRMNIVRFSGCSNLFGQEGERCFFPEHKEKCFTDPCTHMCTAMSPKKTKIIPKLSALMNQANDENTEEII